MSYGNGERRTIIFLEAALAEERKQNDHTMVTAGKIAAEMQMEVARLMAENERYKIALTELVACKDLKESINDHSHGPNHPLRREYYRRQPLAWVAARAALKGEPK